MPLELCEMSVLEVRPGRQHTQENRHLSIDGKVSIWCDVDSAHYIVGGAKYVTDRLRVHSSDCLYSKLEDLEIIRKELVRESSLEKIRGYKCQESGVTDG